MVHGGPEEKGLNEGREGAREAAGRPSRRRVQERSEKSLRYEQARQGVPSVFTFGQAVAQTLWSVWTREKEPAGSSARAVREEMGPREVRRPGQQTCQRLVSELE